MAEYSSIDDFFREDEMNFIEKEVNTNKLYLTVVKAMRYKKIGVVFLDEKGEEKTRYASYNDKKGKITGLEKDFDYKMTDITVMLKEKEALKIVWNVNWVKKHPLLALIRYLPKFSPYEGYRSQLAEVIKTATRVVKNKQFSSN